MKQKKIKKSKKVKDFTFTQLANKELPFAEKCISSEDSFESESEGESESESEIESDSSEDFDSEIAISIDRMIDESELEPIIQIRSDQKANYLLHNQLCKLVRKSTLDPEQFESFLGSLSKPVHLTQGPPGTGKSYLGVVIVQALIIIRQLWISFCPSVGKPPILVLSYKNHAIDEFLQDLIQAENYDISLIRIGGSRSDDPELFQYSEHSLSSGKSSVRESQQRLKKLFQMKMELFSNQKALSPLIKFEANFRSTKAIADNEESRERKKTSHSAAIYLQNLIVQVRELERGLIKTETIDQTLLEEKWTDIFLQDNESQPLFLKSNIIQSLCDGIKHYDSNMSVTDVLLKWISDFNVLPQCSYKLGNQCLATADSITTGLCNQHQCNFLAKNHLRCTNATLALSHFCLNHACYVNNCTQQRLTPPQIFCQNHSCFICIHEGKVAERATTAAPKNTCKNHLLCDVCMELAINQTKFCEDHQERLCAAITKHGKQCKSKVRSKTNPYCTNHHSMYFQKEKSKECPKCAASTKKRKQCQNSAIGDSRFCETHQRQNDEKLELFKQKELELIEQKTEEKKKQLSCLEVKEDGRCKAITKKGNHCTLLAMDTLSFCKNHATTENFELEALAKKNEEVSSSKQEQVQSTDPSVITSKVEELAICNEEPLSNKDDCLQMEVENVEDLDEPENLQHLRDVFMVQEPEYQFLDETDEQSEELQLCEETEDHQTSSRMLPTKWSWDMSWEERFFQCKILEDIYFQFLHRINRHLDKQVELAQQLHHLAKINATSQVYDGKAVIGGTIVGCIARLESIRSTNPFAIIVEEASEVLEPLLLACISSSTCKLEMIGDHLQLKPSLMTKFSFERVNKANYSMFERLIRAPSSHRVPSSALATQRRMRTNICDLTRDFYKHIVEIKDHPICQTRHIGESKKNQERNGPDLNHSLKQLWQCKGREVPGILPHLFFWTHDGFQQKAEVGMSKVNRTEADMVCGLTEFMVSCGVPKSSIAILTPYKGQLMLMRKQLIGAGLLSRQRHPDSCILSTVDQFQGDEADITIISLVTDARSNTPFVKQVNRMIVLLSRARLGMFIVGNIGYFEARPDPSISHWQAAIKKLNQTAEPDSDSNESHYIPFTGPCLGSSISICCPQHRKSTVFAKNHKDLKLGFCQIPCTHKLDCSHPCNYKCHFQNPDQHKLKCDAKVIAPCPKHPKEINCFELFQKAGIQIGKSKMLHPSWNFQCDEMVPITLPCSHECEVTCAEDTKMETTKCDFPRCRKQAYTPFIYPNCKHQIHGECWEIELIKSKPYIVKPCPQDVNHTLNCGHNISMKCQLKQRLDKNESYIPCSAQVTVILPRCGHEVQVSCETAEVLKSWIGNQNLTLGLVKQGIKYGPVDHICNENVEFEKVCGHRFETSCHEAFNFASSQLACNVQEAVVNPECGHLLEVPCHQKISLEKDPRMTRSIPPVEKVEEGHAKESYLESFVNSKCKELIFYQRSCGHQEKIPCFLAKHEIVQQCQQLKPVQHPVCGHEAHIPCYQSYNLSKCTPWPEGKTFRDFITDNSIQDDIQLPQALSQDLEKYLEDCTNTMTIVRKKSCQHKYQVICHLAFKSLGQKSDKCDEIIHDSLPCGHFKTLKCWEYTELCKHPEQYQCQEEVLKPCWNFDACKSQLKSSCSAKECSHSCNTQLSWTCDKGHLFENLPLCKTGIPKNCPECILTCIDDYVEEVYDKMSEESITNHFAGYPELGEVLTIPINFQINIPSFRKSQTTVLGRFHDWLKGQDPWERQLFQPRIQSWFINVEENDCLDDDLKVQNLSKVKLFQGIDVHEWTDKNIKNLGNSKVKKNDQITILCGIGFCCNVCINPDDYPSSKIKQNKKQIGIWISEKQEQGFDCMQSTNNNNEDITTYWSPHALIATHKLVLSSEVLMSMKSSNQSVIPRKLFNKKRIQFLHPMITNFKDDDDSETKTTLIPGLDIQLKTTWDSTSLGQSLSKFQREITSKLLVCAKGFG